MSKHIKAIVNVVAIVIVTFQKFYTLPKYLCKWGIKNIKGIGRSVLISTLLKTIPYVLMFIGLHTEDVLH